MTWLNGQTLIEKGIYQNLSFTITVETRKGGSKEIVNRYSQSNSDDRVHKKAIVRPTAKTGTAFSDENLIKYAS